MEKSASDTDAGCGQGETDSSEACSNQSPIETDHQVAACRETFTHRYCGMTVDVDAMAEARWFNTGYGQIKTVCCKVVWDKEATNDPWMQHVIQSPDCSFLKQRKGQAYIDSVQASLPAVNEEPMLEQPKEKSEIEMLQEGNNTREKEQTCCVCEENPRKVVYLPCRHLSCCKFCDQAQLSCPICKETIQNKIFTFLS